MKYCFVKEGAVVRGPSPRGSLKHPNISISTNTTDAELKNIGWLPFVEVNPNYNGKTQVRSTPVRVVTDTSTVRNKTSQELNDDLESILKLHLNSNPFFKAFAKVAASEWGMTDAQFKSAIKGQM